MSVMPLHTVIGDFYDLFLAKGEHISVSPGFEALGLRVNGKKRSRHEFTRIVHSVWW